MSRTSSKKEKQSGVIPYRINNGKAEVLLISSRTSKRWVIPKGGIAKAMTAADSAVKEAWEEAGVVGQINSSLLGSYQYRKQGKIYHVEVFLLQVEAEYSDWQEANKWGINKRQTLDTAPKALCPLHRQSLSLIDHPKRFAVYFSLGTYKKAAVARCTKCSCLSKASRAQTSSQNLLGAN